MLPSHLVLLCVVVSNRDYIMNGGRLTEMNSKEYLEHHAAMVVTAAAAAGKLSVDESSNKAEAEAVQA